MVVDWVEPVSYTHLDVYKRQLLHDRPDGRCRSVDQGVVWPRIPLRGDYRRSAEMCIRDRNQVAANIGDAARAQLA